MESNKYAIQLREAYDNRKPIPPLRDEIGIDALNLAYEIQNHNTQFRLKAGAQIVGKKIGLTSFAVQKQLGVDQPDFGVLFNDMEVLNGQSISMSELMQPKVEAEIAFLLGDDLDRPNLTSLDILQAIDFAMPAIEIVGSRIENWDIKITDTIADNASASHYVIGHSVKMINEFDMVNCKMKMSNHNEIVSEGMGSACLGSPLNAMLWLAQKMMELGNPLKSGELILSGALGPMVNVKSGDLFTAEFEGLGNVSVSFTD